jgi:LPS sulfotransferase NodH
MRLQKSGIDFMEVDYNELIMDRVSVIQQIKEFIRSDVNIDEAVAFVQPSKNRFKIAELTHGI